MVGKERFLGRVSPGLCRSHIAGYYFTKIRKRVVFGMLRLQQISMFVEPYVWMGFQRRVARSKGLFRSLATRDAISI
ncbi:MAG: hypothetical protein AB1390_10730 [Nitrospirota bacterium]